MIRMGFGIRLKKIKKVSFVGKTPMIDYAIENIYKKKKGRKK